MHRGVSPSRPPACLCPRGWGESHLVDYRGMGDRNPPHELPCQRWGCMLTWLYAHLRQRPCLGTSNSLLTCCRSVGASAFGELEYSGIPGTAGLPASLPCDLCPVHKLRLHSRAQGTLGEGLPSAPGARCLLSTLHACMGLWAAVLTAVLLSSVRDERLGHIARKSE